MGIFRIAHQGWRHRTLVAHLTRVAVPLLLFIDRWKVPTGALAPPLRRFLLNVLSLQIELGWLNRASATLHSYLKHRSLLLPTAQLMVEKRFMLEPVEAELRRHCRDINNDSKDMLPLLVVLLVVMYKRNGLEKDEPLVLLCKRLIEKHGVPSEHFHELLSLSEPSLRAAMIAVVPHPQRLLVQFYQASEHMDQQLALELASELLKGPYRTIVLPSVFSLWFKQGNFALIEQELEASCRVAQDVTAHQCYAFLSYNFHLLSCAQHHYRHLAAVKGRFNIELACHGPLAAFASLEREFNDTLREFCGIAFVDSLSVDKLDDTTPILLVGKIDSLNNQFFYTFVLSMLTSRFKQLSMVCDKRIGRTLSNSFPTVNFIELDKFDNDKLAELPLSKRYLFNRDIMDKNHDRRFCHIPFSRYFSDWQAIAAARQKGRWLKPEPDRVAYWRQWLAGFNKPAIGLSVGSGKVDFERSMYMVEHRQLPALGRFDDLLVVCLDHHFSSEQLAAKAVETGLALTGVPFDLFHQLDELLALLAALELIVVTPNNLMDMGSALNIEVLVLDPTWQMKQWQAKGEACYLLSDNTHFIRPAQRSSDYLSELNEKLYQALRVRLSARQTCLSSGCS